MDEASRRFMPKRPAYVPCSPSLPSSTTGATTPVHAEGPVTGRITSPAPAECPSPKSRKKKMKAGKSLSTVRRVTHAMRETQPGLAGLHPRTREALALDVVAETTGWWERGSSRATKQPITAPAEAEMPCTGGRTAGRGEEAEHSGPPGRSMAGRILGEDVRTVPAQRPSPAGVVLESDTDDLEMPRGQRRMASVYDLLRAQHGVDPTWTRDIEHRAWIEYVELLIIQAWRTEVEGDLLGFLSISVRPGHRQLIVQELTIPLAQLVDDFPLDIISQCDESPVLHVLSRTLTPYLQWSACLEEQGVNNNPPSQQDYLNPWRIIDLAFFQPRTASEDEELTLEEEKEEGVEEGDEEEEEETPEEGSYSEHSEGEQSEEEEEEEDEEQEESEWESMGEKAGEEEDLEAAARRREEIAAGTKQPLEYASGTDLPISDNPAKDPEPPKPEDGDLVAETSSAPAQRRRNVVFVVDVSSSAVVGIDEISVVIVCVVAAKAPSESSCRVMATRTLHAMTSVHVADGWAKLSDDVANIPGTGRSYSLAVEDGPTVGKAWLWRLDHVEKKRAPWPRKRNPLRERQRINTLALCHNHQGRRTRRLCGASIGQLWGRDDNSSSPFPLQVGLFPPTREKQRREATSSTSAVRAMVGDPSSTSAFNFHRRHERWERDDHSPSSSPSSSPSPAPSPLQVAFIRPTREGPRREASRWTSAVRAMAAGDAASPDARTSPSSSSSLDSTATAAPTEKPAAALGPDPDAEPGKNSGRKDGDKPLADVAGGAGTFDWSLHWYGVAADDHLDRRQPHAITVLGRGYVLWWDMSAFDDGQEEEENGLVAAQLGKEKEKEQREEQREREREKEKEKEKEERGHAIKAANQGSTGGGTWRAFLDRCPHRLAPLSEGRIDEQGRLQCSYHGWSFSGDGTCKNVPQDGPEQRVTRSPRACAITVPTRVAHGVVFLWPDESAQGAELAARSPLPLDPGAALPGSVRLYLYVRELQYSYETLVENVLDESHFPFAHHKTAPAFHRDRGGQGDLHVSSFNGRQGFAGQCRGFALGTAVGHVDFKGPSIITKRAEIPFKGRPITSIQSIYITPSAPGRVIFVFSGWTTPPPQGSGGALGGVMAALLGRLTAVVRAFRNTHLFMNRLLDGDAVLLHVAEKNLNRIRREDKKDWNLAYYMPASADRFTIAFRQWLHKYAGGGVKYHAASSPASAAAGTPAADVATRGPHRFKDLDKVMDKVLDEAECKILSSREVLDRYSQHTVKCQICMGQLNFYKILQRALAMASVVCIAIAACISRQAGTVALCATSGANAAACATSTGAAAFSASAPVVARLVLVVLAVWAAIGAVKLADHIEEFVYKGYNHALIP
ncbi:hypothetical protein CBR_g49638 [Chara braunii]|uniref:Rieske domain-containing protein n=1 Tax=Chara braunii TaxID=69332 RepID=A0A388M5C9_CHABU|nr:hypothetical protein CBR_g49638 [Chara braunii]|eukprot:GBG89787.1 hypothetical protein CBR_g49638 [Chara braunii]